MGIIQDEGGFDIQDEGGFDIQDEGGSNGNWVGKINGITNSSKVNNILVSNIKSINKIK